MFFHRLPDHVARIVAMCSGPSIALMAALTVALVVSVSAGGPPSPQVIVLDFDLLNTGEETDHDYTTAERDQIVMEMNHHLGPLGVVVSPTPPPSGPYSTVFFNAEAAGTSDGVDFRNEDKTDTASVNAKMMLAIVGFEEPDMTSERIVRVSINVGIHEALHLFGARHQDSYAPPGTGLPFAGLADDYDPEYPGPIYAPLTDQTFESLTLVLGLSADKLLQDDMFISPRTALKVVAGELVPPVAQVAGNISPPEAQMVDPFLITVPNTLPPDLELPPGLVLPDCVEIEDLEVVASIVIITGDLFDPPLNPPNYYKIPHLFPPSELWIPLNYTIEVYSEVLDHRLSSIDTALYVLDPGPPEGPGYLPVDYHGEGAHNKHGIENGDPAIVTMPPPPYDAFIVEVVPEEHPAMTGGEYELIVYALGIVVPTCPCPGDVNCDGVVDIFDLTELLSAWGDCPDPCPPSCPADMTNADGTGTDCAVNVFDLLLLLSNWG